MAFDLGLHWSIDDPNTKADPLILGMARQIAVGKDEGTIYNRIPAYPTLIDNFEFEIFDRARTALSGVIGTTAGTGWVDGTATTSLPMSAGAVGILTVGHVLLVEDEQVIVKSVDRSANTIDVVARGHGASSGASHADNTAFKVIGSAINNTDLKNIESFAELSGKYLNYCQRFAETIDAEFDDELAARKAFDQKPQLILEAMDRLAKKLYLTAIYGTKSLKTKTSPYTTAGLLEQLSVGGGVRSPLRYDATGVTSPVAVLQNALQLIWAAGGNPTHVYMSPANRRKYNPLMEQFKVGTVGQRSGVVGTDVATSFFFEGSELEFVSDKDFPSTRIEIVTETKLGKGWRKGDVLRGPNKEPQDSTLELRYSLYGSWFLVAEGVGVDHIDIYNVAI